MLLHIITAVWMTGAPVNASDAPAKAPTKTRAVSTSRIAPTVPAITPRESAASNQCPSNSSRVTWTEYVKDMDPYEKLFRRSPKVSIDGKEATLIRL